MDSRWGRGGDNLTIPGQTRTNRPISDMSDMHRPDQDISDMDKWDVSGMSDTERRIV